MTLVPMLRLVALPLLAVLMAPASAQLHPYSLEQLSSRQLKPMLEKPQRESYEFARSVKPDDWLRLDLKKVANRNYVDVDGSNWIGIRDMDLRYFRPGRYDFYGVPFDVIDPAANGGRAVITTRSGKILTTDGKPAPDSVTIPVESHLSAIYFLHGCAYAAWGDLRTYRVHYEDGGHVDIALLPAGGMQGQTENIQDWHPHSQKVEGNGARPVPVPGAENPASSGELRYLYTLEWLNPSPGKKIISVEFLSPGKGDSSIFLFAVTGAKANEK